jgi:hypothetical protein
MNEQSTVLERRKRVAVHEAGHAVAARALGHHVELVEVSDGSHFNGRIDWTPGVENHTRTPPELAALVMVAGYLAEALVFGEADEIYCATDRDQAWEASAGHVVWGDTLALAELKQLHDRGIPVQNSQWPRLGNACEVYQNLETECRVLLEAHREDLYALAAHLELHRKCESSEIDAICSKKKQS